MKVQFYDPAVCCLTGACGTPVEPGRARFAEDLQWLTDAGVEFERYNLAHEPAAFFDSVLVRTALQAEGPACLPLVLIDGEIRFRGAYPTRRELAAAVGLESRGRRL